MIQGIDKFREHFADFSDKYVLIGGVACSLCMRESDIEFRLTNDFDIVLYVEALDHKFGTALWQFIKDGGYRTKQKSTGDRQFYRFDEPLNADYPKSLELFSRAPEGIKLPKEAHLTPLPMEDELSSLSAILVQEDYYDYVKSGMKEVDGVSIVETYHLIVLKLRAWMDLRARREIGEQVDSKRVKKHRNDIFRLFQTVEPNHREEVPEAIRKDIAEGLEMLRSEANINLEALGVHSFDIKDIVNTLSSIYSLDASA